MQDLKKNIEFFVKKIEYVIPLILTAILSFGFVITHYSVNIDTLSAERYYREGELLAQNRYGGVLLDKILGVMEYNPFFVDCLAVICLIAASITFCILFKKISNNKINMVSYTIFSCLFVSYPLINEIFVYTPMSFGVCFSFFIVAIVLNLLYSYLQDKKLMNLIYVTLLLCLITSIYESSAVVFLCGIFVIEILDYIYRDKNKQIVNTIKQLIIMLIPLVIALIINFVISNIILNVLDIEPSINAEKRIMYKKLGFIEGINNLIVTMFYAYVINGMLYLPITVMLISCVLMLVLGIIYGIKQKNATIFLLFLGCICSIFSLSVLQGNSAPYRTCQVFQLFSAVAFMLIIQFIIRTDKMKVIKYVGICLSFLIIFYQAKELNKYFYLNYTRYEQEKIALISIAEKLKNEYDIQEKPVIFIGNYNYSNYIAKQVNIKTNTIGAKIANILVKIISSTNTTYSEQNEYIPKVIQTNINSYLNWGTRAFKEVNTEILKWLDVLGYNEFEQGNNQMINEVITNIINGTILMKSNTIIEYDDYILAII